MFRSLLRLTWGCVLLASPALAVELLPPSGLLCDLIPDASAPVVSAAPALSWLVGPAEPGSLQAGYQVQVARTAAALAAGVGDVWDSGPVASADSVAVRYAGPPLEPGATYHWHVRIRGATGGFTAYGPAARFTVATKPGIWPRRPLVTTPVAPVRQVEDGSPGSWRVDFGRAAFAWLEITVDSPAAGTLTVRLGEKLDAAGTIDRKPGGTIRFASATVPLLAGRHTYRVDLPPDKRNTGKDAVRLPAELGVVLPFRHVELDGCPGRPELVQQTVHYPFDERAAAFHADDPTLEAVWKLCQYSIKATSFCGIYVDGDRERIAYEGDAYINQLGHYATDREFALARATYEYLLDHPTWPTEWAQHMVLIAWADWMYTGDLAAVQRTWDRLLATKSLRSRMRPDGLLDTKGLRDLVDWPQGERDGYEMKPVNTVVNAFHCRVQHCLGDLAEALGKPAEAATFRADAVRATAALNQVCVDPATGLYVDGEGSRHSAQHANLWPLAFGLVPPARLAAVRDFVVAKKMAVSVYGAQFLLEGLFRAGAADQAIALMTERGDRGWWGMLEQGSTVTLEAWSIKAKANLDWNHAWGAAPANVIPRYVLGVEPLTPGGGLLRIRPQVGALRHVDGTVPTIRGPVTVAVDNPAGGPWKITATIPGNTRAVIDLGTRTEEVGPGRHQFTR